jgi:hypothetical protein
MSTRSRCCQNRAAVRIELLPAVAAVVQLSVGSSYQVACVACAVGVGATAGWCSTVQAGSSGWLQWASGLNHKIGDRDTSLATEN